MAFWHGYKDGEGSSKGRRRSHDHTYDADLNQQHASKDSGQFELNIPDKYIDRQTSTTDFHLFSKAAKGGNSEMSNPYLDRGVQMPYQISQNRYKEQVLGSHYENYNQNRPDAFDGYNNYGRPPAIPESNRAYHNWPIGAHPLEVAAERRPHRHPQYDSPRYEPSAAERGQYRPPQYESPRREPNGAPDGRQHRQPQYESPRHEPNGAPDWRQQRQPQYESPRHEPNSQERIPPRPQYYGDSPRQDYESRTYRSGRPDIGVQRESNVPYPQEPIRKAKHDYEQPPDIGFDPYKDAADKPKNLQFFGASNEDAISNPGWLLLLRYDKDGDDQVRKALTFASQIDKDGGKVLGIARPYGIRVHEGGDGWVTYGRIVHYQGGHKEVQTTPVREQTRHCVLAIYYPSLRKAQEWFDRDSWFKQKDFPPPYTTDCVALPLSSAIDYRNCKTLVMSEYPKISHADSFRKYFSNPTEQLMRSKYRASPYLVKTLSIPSADPTRRVARHLRGHWINQNSVIAVSAFESMNEVQRYFSDEEYHKARIAQDQVSAPTTVIFELESAGHY